MKNQKKMFFSSKIQIISKNWDFFFKLRQKNPNNKMARKAEQKDRKKTKTKNENIFKKFQKYISLLRLNSL